MLCYCVPHKCRKKNTWHIREMDVPNPMLFKLPEGFHGKKKLNTYQLYGQQPQSSPFIPMFLVTVPKHIFH